MVYSPAFKDLYQTFRRLPVILYLAISDLKARYRRSILGPFWLTLSTLLGAAGLGFLWSELMAVSSREFVPALTAGLIIWQFISSAFNESTTVFVKQAVIIRNVILPLSLFPLQLIFKQLINLAHTAPVFIIVALAFNMSFTSLAWMAIPGIIIVTLNLLWMSLLIGMLGARFRDLEFLVASIMPILMLLSPVFYRPKYLPFSEIWVWMNPFSHFIEIVRSPLLGELAPAFVVQTNLAMLMVGIIFTLWFFNYKYQRIAFWL